MQGEMTFTGEDAVRTQRKLRAVLGLGDEIFPLPAFIGMISDEIQQMRQAGRSDLEVIGIIANVTGHAIDPADLARYYASPEQRGRGDVD